ncbi:MAG: glycosyltransferase [Cyanobacteria bacterium J06648_16]
MSKREQRIFRGLAALWWLTLLNFWGWWLRAVHVLAWSDMAFISLLLAWYALPTAYYFYFVSRMRQVNPAVTIPPDWPVAMVVTKAPSEPWAVVQKTLTAMLAQDYPHDTWLADEAPQPETLRWCRQQGVNVSCRQGIKDYHRRSWPRRTQCKEGNLAYFYDRYGYGRYRFVAQLDADHVPAPGYLRAMLRPFTNPAVGYVAAPSICDTNAATSWTARARAFVEAGLHGSLQAGYNAGWAPMCIGSHYAVRVSALREIGGLGPELAEDHSTTLMMNACGWRGVFALDAEAYGEGPACFFDFLMQEFQWSRSLTMLLLTVTPKYWPRLTPRLKLQFAFSQLWYPVYATCFCLGLALPLIGLLRDTPWVNVRYEDFVVRLLLLDSACIVTMAWIRHCGEFRPKQAAVISWETLLFHLARWPWVMAGVGSAIATCLLRKQLTFQVTPKGERVLRPLPLVALSPYLALVVISALPVIVPGEVSHTSGYYLLALRNSGLYLLLCTVIVTLQARENLALGRCDRAPQIAVGLTALFFLAAAGVGITKIL